jgi:hypothetical protein
LTVFCSLNLSGGGGAGVFLSISFLHEIKKILNRRHDFMIRVEYLIKDDIKKIDFITI